MAISRSQMNQQIQNKKKVKKVVKGLKKASKLHAKQAKSLSSLKLKDGGLVSYNGRPLKPGERTGNIGCGAIAPGKRKFTKIG